MMDHHLQQPTLGMMQDVIVLVDLLKIINDASHLVNLQKL